MTRLLVIGTLLAFFPTFNASATFVPKIVAGNTQTVALLSEGKIQTWGHCPLRKDTTSSKRVTITGSGSTDTNITDEYFNTLVLGVEPQRATWDRDYCSQRCSGYCHQAPVAVPTVNITPWP